MWVAYPVSPWPGPSSEKVARPRRRKTFSHSKNSSFVESRPGSSTASGGDSAPSGRRRLPTIVVPSNGISIRSAIGSRSLCTSRSAATALSAAPRYCSRSTIQTNFAKWYESAAWFHAWPAVTVRPSSSASRARAGCTSPFATHAGSHSGHVSTRAVTRWKSLKSTPCETNRGAQFAIAASTRSSAIAADHLLDRASEVAQHHGGRVPSRPGRNRRARMGRRAGLVQPGDRQPVLRPSRHGPQRTRLRRAHLPAVAGAAPVVLVQRLQVDRALHQRRQDLVVRQVGRVPAQVLEVRARDLVLHLGPAGGAAVRELVRVEADHLERVVAVRRTLRVGHGRADHEEGRVVRGDRAPAGGPADPPQPGD